jgi:hypothetical protein
MGLNLCHIVFGITGLQIFGAVAIGADIVRAVESADGSGDHEAAARPLGA